MAPALAPSAASPAAAAKPRRTQAERTEDTRRRILDAAMALLASKGYAGLRTADVAVAAGVSRGAQTHHFPSKDDLVVAVVEHVFQRASDQGVKRARRTGSQESAGPSQGCLTPSGGLTTAGRQVRGRSVDDALKALLSDSQEFFFSELFLIALDLAIQGRMKNEGDAVGQISAATRLPVEEHWLAALVEAGVPPKVADDLLWLTISIVRGLAVRRLWQHDAPRFKRLFKLWREMVAGYLAALPDSTASPPSRSSP